MDPTRGQSGPSTLRKTAPSVMKYQYDQLLKHLILLQDHASARTCPYSPAGEMCIRKHLLTIEAYAQETIPMEDTETFKERLQDLEAESRSCRLTEEAAICGEEIDSTEGLEQWARRWRKEFEVHALICELRKAAEEPKAAEKEPEEAEMAVP